MGAFRHPLRPAGYGQRWMYEKNRKAGVQMKKAFLVLLPLILVCAAAVSLWLLHEHKYWPFAQTSGIPAFLDTEFGMSRPETERALRSYGVRLIGFPEFQKLEESIHFKHDGIVSLDELLYDLAGDKHERETKQQCLYMPSIKMLDSKVQARFAFHSGRLTHVDIVFQPLDSGKSDEVLSHLQAEFVQRFTKYSEHKPDQIKNVFTYFYSNEVVNAFIFVVRRNPEQQVFQLGLVWKAYVSELENTLKRRDKNAL